MNLLPLVVVWAILATAVLVLAFYRRAIASKEDDYLHVDSNVAAKQVAVAKKLEVIDRWGKILTIIAAAFGVILLGLFLYNGWTQGGRLSY
jgi:hypothetical protein